MAAFCRPIVLVPPAVSPARVPWPVAVLALPLVAMLILGAGAAPAWAHGDLARNIAEVTAHLRAELARPVDGHLRAKIHLERGELYRLHREFSRAARDYDAAERYEPGLQAIPLARARMWLESGRPVASRRVLERFLASHPGHAEALTLHARVLVALGRGARAVQALDQALRELTQPEPDHYLARADILAGLGRRHLPRALMGLDEGITRMGPLVSLDERAIDLEVALGRHDQALARIDRQAAATIRKDVWLARRADVLDRAGRTDDARQARREALALLRALPPPLQSRPATRQLLQQLTTALDRPLHARKVP
jgi:tetratricopeptide (TPR) repeat protein